MIPQSRYLVRFDDLCPTMNWSMWQRIEAVLVEQRISPLLAVVPDNKDKTLVAEPEHPEFWAEVQNWQARGWTIGLHGYQHAFATRSGGIVGIQQRSEFAGLPRVDQENKLIKAVEILRSHGIEPQAWIAPAHSFDWSTVAILAKIGISTISDGLAIAPHNGPQGMLWVPQQLWRFRWRPFGVWTVCYHPNHWDDKAFRQFASDVQKYRQLITDLPNIVARYGARRRGFMDRCYAVVHGTIFSSRALLGAHTL